MSILDFFLQRDFDFDFDFDFHDFGQNLEITFWFVFGQNGPLNKV